MLLDILVVDDDEQFATFLANVLRARFPMHLVHVTFGPSQALQVAAKNPVVLVITDYRMQGMTGTELAKVLRKRLSTSIRTVLVTGDTDPPRDGVDAVLQKPFSLEDLYKLVIGLLPAKNDRESKPSSLPSREGGII
jgi:two-component system chemotaxis response regulator CheY